MEAPGDMTWSGYSVAERDRRWSAVRKNAAAAGLDCVFVPVGNGADARYLTQRHDVSVVLPTDGRPAIAVSDRGDERGASGWLTEIRPTQRAWAGPMAQ